MSEILVKLKYWSINFTIIYIIFNPEADGRASCDELQPKVNLISKNFNVEKSSKIF